MGATRIAGVHGREIIPLVVRARIENTFFGLGMFAGGTLFLTGAYLLTHAIRDPMKASEVSVLAAGFVLALGSFLITYVVWPRSGLELARNEDFEGIPEYWKGPVRAVYGEAVQTKLEAKRVLVEGKNLPGPM